MKHRYTSLGAVNAASNRLRGMQRDPLLARTRPAAAALLRSWRRIPPSARLSAMRQSLDQFQPGLFDRVRRVASRLQKTRKMTADQALQEALALSLADASIERITALGRRVRRSAGAGGLGASLSFEGSASTSGGASVSGSGDASDILLKLATNVSCSDGLRSRVTDLVGRKEGRDAHDATQIGFEAAQALAKCPGGAPSTEPVPPLAPAEKGTSMVVPLVVGGLVLVVVAGGVYVATRKK